MLVTLQPGAGTGGDPVVHLGEEFVFCLEGKVSKGPLEGIRVIDFGQYIGGIGSIVVNSFAAFMDEHTAIAPLSRETLVESPWSLFQREENHLSGHVSDDVAPTGIRPQHMLIKAPSPAPKFGAQTREPLAEPGYTVEEIERLIHSGVAGEGWSERYLPT